MSDSLSRPILKMASFFLCDALPLVRDVRDVYAEAGALKDRGIVPTQGEERFLRQIVWAMLKIEGDEGELRPALARLAALTLAIIEDDDFEIPDDRKIGSRAALEALAGEVQNQLQQMELLLGTVIATRNLTIAGPADVARLEKTLAAECREELFARALHGIALHLRQGEQLLAKHKDPGKETQHRHRYGAACERASALVARLLAIAPDRDVPIVRQTIVRRELKRIEVDALGVIRLTEVEQRQQAAKMLAWTQVELGEEVTAENRARLAEELRRAAAPDKPIETSEGDDDGAWLFQSQEA